MSLIPSVITSFIIVGAIWGLAIFQPSTALASDADKLQVKYNTQKLPIKQKKQMLEQDRKILTNFTFDELQISGISQNMSLSQLPSLWQEFNDNKVLQNNLMKNPSTVYVYYRDFSSDYKSAMVSIGYDTQEFKSSISKINMPAISFKPLLSKGKYDDMQIQQAWEKLDYRKYIVAIVEVHYLNDDSIVKSSEMFVSYK